MLNKTVEPLKKYYIVLIAERCGIPDTEDRSRLTLFNVTADEAYKLRDGNQHLLKWPMRYAVRSVR